MRRAPTSGRGRASGRAGPGPAAAAAPGRATAPGPWSAARRVRALGLVLWFVWSGWAEGQAPSVEALFPAGGQRGTSFELRAIGRIEPWPAQVWADDPELKFVPSETNGWFRVQVGTAAATGPHWVRVFNEHGASAPRLFVVGEVPELIEKQTEEAQASEELIERLPVTINGLLRRRSEVDVAQVRCEAGQVLHAAVQARRLDAPVRVQVVLRGEQGQTLTGSDDGVGPDPELSFAVGQAGVYRLELAAAPSAGASVEASTSSEAVVYRLTLHTESAPPVDLAGLAAQVQEAQNVVRYRRRFIGFPLTMPGVTHGRVSWPAQEDRYYFEARRNQSYRFRLKAGSLGSPLAGVLRLINEQGEVAAQSAPAPDPELTWIAPDNGVVILAITDVQGRGGPTYAYELDAAPAAPHVAAEVHPHTLRLRPGQTADLIAVVSRPDRSTAVPILLAAGLPPGVTAAPTPVPPERDQVSVTLRADREAPPTNAPFQLILVSTDPAAPQGGPASAPVQGRHAAPGELLLNRIDQLWVTVLPAP